MLAVCNCGETHRLERETLTSMGGMMAEQFLSEINKVSFTKGTRGGRNYHIGDMNNDLYRCLNFYRRASKGEIHCDLLTIYKCPPADEAPIEDLVSNEFFMMPIPCPWHQEQEEVMGHNIP